VVEVVAVAPAHAAPQPPAAHAAAAFEIAAHAAGPSSAVAAPAAGMEGAGSGVCDPGTFLRDAGCTSHDLWTTVGGLRSQAEGNSGGPRPRAAPFSPPLVPETMRRRLRRPAQRTSELSAGGPLALSLVGSSSTLKPGQPPAPA
jgi:hypothetical protein